MGDGGDKVILVRDWLGNEVELHADDLNDALRCVRATFEHLRDLITPEGEPTTLLLVFVNGIEHEVLDGKTLKDGDLIELLPVLHRG